ncbi:MAG TPA: GspE/PulE family protein [Candidatus Paceibacterota bacterium]|nr:GspE/PulE family protein [Candidatus Paceibacterota bacterium]HOL54034.1 GspE/PulE family protein [Candidatus Paceibacterota bacterium]HON21938.1 GspE/PulE family protein [Candidatus Paceibacterota bacterium]HPP16992.1 GspE/PulE family protein [Candidatus Paceibacterota bacterium]
MIPNKTLIELLLKNKKIDQATADKLLKESENLNRPVEEIIYERNLIPQDEIVKIKSDYYKIPVKTFSKEDVIPNEVLNIIPEEVARTHQIVAFKKEGDTLYVGMLSPDDQQAQDILKFIAKQRKLNIAIYLVTKSDLENIWKNYRSFATRLKEIQDSVEIFKRQSKPSHQPYQQRVVRIDEASGIIAEEAPIIKIVSTILEEAVESNASDIHIEPMRNKLRVRFRLDGELKEMLSLPLELQPAIVARIKILSDLKIDETRIPQDGRFRTILDNKEIDFRVATFPTALGEKVAIRVLNPYVGLKTLDGLGIREYHKTIIEEAVAKPFGMILATGPTGSGKTTTLYAILQGFNKESINVVSLEDPVEYFIEGLNQSQVKPEIGYDFASGLRQIVRQDPDVIMVGEIRDNETAALAVHAALTGHIVLSTLHTNNAVGVIPRLIDMKIEPYLLPASLILMMAQRLVGRLCDNCKQKEEATGSLKEAIDKSVASLPKDLREKYKKDKYEIYLPQGCKECNFKGTKGRLPLFEVLKMTPSLEEIILKDPSDTNLKAEAEKQGMITLRQDGIIKALEGLVSIDEVLKETIEME